MKIPLLLSVALLSGACSKGGVLSSAGSGGSEFIPSSYADDADRPRQQAHMKRLRKAIAAGQPLHLLFGPRSRSTLVADGLDLGEEDVLVDIGSGTGAFQMMLLEKGYPFEKMYAVDVDQMALDVLKLALAESGLEHADRVEVVHSRPDDILVPPETATRALLLNTPFYLDEAGRYQEDPGSLRCLMSLVNALKPGGILHVVERHVTANEEDVSVDDDPAQRCGAITGVFSGLGMHLVSQQIVQVDSPDTGAHCWVKLAKPATAPVMELGGSMDPSPGGQGGRGGR